MIKELSEAFNSFVDSLSRHPFATLSTVLIAIVLYLGYQTLESIRTIVVPPNLEAERFHEQLAASEQINQALELLRKEENAHSIIIRQFHNGKHDLTGIPFTKSSMTFYTMSEEFQEVEEPLSAMSTSLSKVWNVIDKPECLVISNVGIDKATKYYMEYYELNKIVVCPMVNLLDYPVGTLTVGYKQADAKVNPKKIQEVAVRVTGYLDGTSKN